MSTSMGGKPIDEIDEICAERKKCVACLEINFEEEGRCSIDDVKYKFDKEEVNGEPKVTGDILKAGKVSKSAKSVKTCQKCQKT